MPKISVDSIAADEPESLDVALSMLENIAAEGKTCVVFDEFQDILRLKDAERVLQKLKDSTGNGFEPFDEKNGAAVFCPAVPR